MDGSPSTNYIFGDSCTIKFHTKNNNKIFQHLHMIVEQMIATHSDDL